MEQKIKSPTASLNIFNMFKLFIKALLTESFTYNIFKNPYIFFGFLAGLQVPAAYVVGDYFGSIGLREHDVKHFFVFFKHWVDLHLSQPVFMAVFDIATIALAIVFGALGTINRNIQRKKMADILNNIHIGIMLIDPQFNIESDYSSICEKIFGTKKLAGKKIENLLFPSKEGSRQFLTNYLNEIFNHEMFINEDINEHNPFNIIEYESEDGSNKKILAVEFYRVWNDVIIKKVMVHIEDITETVNLKKQLEEAAASARTELDKTAQILNAGIELYQQFIQEGNNLIKQIKTSLKGLFSQRDVSRINEALLFLSQFRVKALNLGLTFLVRKTHNLEKVLHNMKQNFSSLNESMVNEIITAIDELQNSMEEDSL
ncbi:MAG: hypothetical protein OEZ13_00445 [Spirochaetia bacterium]|nr:hypothetical protein [Spirochaetia bacterium]